MIEERRHAVRLGNDNIGTLIHRENFVKFAFDDDYWSNPDRKVLGLWFENNPKTSPQAAHRLPRWFSNLLPEGRLRQWIALDRGVSTAREMELLLRVGHDLPGAIEIVEDQGRTSSGAFDEQVEESTTDPEDSRNWKFSLAGVGMKFSMLQAGDRLTVPASNEVGDWIVKLPDSTYKQVPLNEFSMMTLAKSVGIDVPKVALVNKSDLPVLPKVAWPGDEDVVYTVSRFDRSSDGHRIHIEDFAQVRGFYPEDKYTGTFETVAALSYRNHDIGSLQEFTRRLVFNFLIGNGDAHLKNWSLIYPNGRSARLAPAYDLVSTAGYMGSNEEDLGLKFGGTRQFERINWKMFERLENRLGAKGANLSGVVEDTVLRFESKWQVFDFKCDELRLVEQWISSHLDDTKRRMLS